jgi:two-component system, NtrC family, response regulator HydG
MSSGNNYGPLSREEVTALLQHRFDPSPLPEPFRITVTAGEDTGKTLSLDGSQPYRVLVGTAETCALRLSDRTVSRRHVALDPVGRRVRVTDLGSTNGTRVNGISVTEAFLEGSEVITVGSTTFRVELANQRGQAQISHRMNFGNVIGVSTEMRRLYPLLERLAQADVPVLLEGEPGTGKTLTAEGIHIESPRAQQGPFVVVDCTAIPPNLLELELFGHEANVFAGVPQARSGAFERAHGGTLLIDEIGELAPHLQMKVLHAIDHGQVCPYGGQRILQVNVRVVASTRRDLDREVQAGRFSDELLRRLTGARVELPPLRIRRGDLPVLLRHFCRELQGDESTLNAELFRAWEEYPWPGNVRELRHALARHLALGELANMTNNQGPAAAAQLEARVDSGDVFDRALDLPLGEARQEVVAEFERRYVERMLEKHGGNVTRAAESAGVARRYFQILKARVARK